MARTIWHCHLAVSLDGRIARPDGSVDWLADYPAEDFGFESFLAGVDAILMGRGTYDAVRRMGDWPYPGKPTLVLTSRPLDDPPEGVEAHAGDAAAIAAACEARGYRRVWIEGGGQVIRAMIAIGKLDVLEMAVIPIILGEGIPLFPPGTAELRLRLRHCEARAGGALHLVYERPG
ncbi:dihydrofolate reductase family protein [Siccirubricoccus sp. KC 17139]|uniref:Dihydrofolate reductase family protein n=1 Tax=Siccirubricoccus soli TaxID=2899147 RepID=A0ABT1DB74_9PROT|nr:dihydrofolate reductase family protein [Siccirubricoccus soli]MCO6419181.1 dihydrofolate reductase family protein [Siccirubricoccus soli]MCP2685316.1 dihydrofolate reductase family protein [Siccirubricoccus soli]